MTLLERQARRWRRAAAVLAAVAAGGGLMAFRSAGLPTIEAERVVLHSPVARARSIELSVTPQGALQAQFLGDGDALRAMSRSNEFVLRDQSGHEIAHLGGPVARNVAP